MVTPIQFSARRPLLSDRYGDSDGYNAAMEALSRAESRGYVSKQDVFTGRDLPPIPMDLPSEVTQKVSNARTAFNTWKDVPLKTRAKVLIDVAKYIQDNANAIADTITAETGKPIRESFEADIASSLSLLDFYAKNGPKALKNKRFSPDKSLLMARFHTQRRVPRGVVGVIAPWNYPLAIPMGGVAASLMAGNTVLLKPSELTMDTGKVLVDAFQTVLKQHNLPTDAVQLVAGNRTVAQSMIKGDVDYIIFTGSDKAGYSIRETLQARGKQISLELGGSDPMVILDSADLDAATTYALWGRFTNAGQTCAATKRLIVPESKKDDVIRLMKEKTEALIVGDSRDAKTHMGPVISEAQRTQLHEQVQEAVSKGARLITGGEPIVSDELAGFYYAPTLLDLPNTDEAKNSAVWREELFGPVLPIITYKNVDEAIALANDSKYGLTASVFGKPGDVRLNQVADKLEAGNVLMNDVGPTNFAMPSVPWGGWKSSGPGFSHSLEGMLDTTLLQTQTSNQLYRLPLLRKQPWHFKDATKTKAIQPNKSENPFSTSLIKSFASPKRRDKLKPSFWIQVLKNRSKTKI